MRLVKFIINNFYFRNGILLCIVFIPLFIQYIAYHNVESSDVIYRGVVIVSLYLAVLLHNLVFFEKILLQKKYLAYVISTILSVYLMHKLLIALGAYIYRSIPQYSSEKWLSIFWVDLVYIYAGFAVYITLRYFKQEEKTNSLKLLHKETELMRLKEQLQPHFLFNALNNIYSHSLQNNEKTNELILMLSEQMRYILIQSDADSISISDEIKFIKNYIGFEKERLGARCIVVFDEDVQNKDVAIQPLLFFPFVENAFKHGTNSISNCEIHIQLKASATEIHFSIINSIFNDNTVVSTNIGLKNIERRLKLLYPDRYSLQINLQDNKYSVQLTIYV